MFIILLTYSRPLEEVDVHLAGHKAWVKQGFDDGVLIASGGQKPRVGGAILAVGGDRDAIEKRVAEDPFVSSGVAEATVIEFRPSTVDPRLAFLKE